MEHEVEGSRPRGRQKKTWKEVLREDYRQDVIPTIQLTTSKHKRDS